MRTLWQMAIDAIKEGHAVCSPSKADQWMNCPAAIRMWEFVRANYGIDDTSSTAAREGTERHKYLEDVLSNTININDVPEDCRYDVETAARAIIGVLSDSFYGAAEVKVNVYKGMTYVNTDSIFKSVDGFHLGDLLPGSADYLAYDYESKTLWVFDAKFGRIAISPNSRQLKCYALGAFDWITKVFGVSILDNIEHIKLAIAQPHVSSELSVYEIAFDELKTFAMDVKAALFNVAKCYDTHASNAEDCVAGDEQCQWCKAKNYCQAYETMLVGSPADMEPPSAEALAEIGMSPVPAYERTDDEVLASAYTYAMAMEKWIEKVKEVFTARLKQVGEPIGKYELRRLRGGTTKWTESDPQVIAKALGVDVFKIVTLDTPSKVAKRIGIDISEFTEQGEDVMGVQEIG